jgi:hypothetical protein
MVEVVGGAGVVAVGVLELVERVQCRDLFEGKLYIMSTAALKSTSVCPYIDGLRDIVAVVVVAAG